MPTQAKSRSTTSLLSVTILMSMCVTPAGSALASELPARFVFKPGRVGKIGQGSGGVSSADNVDEARWAPTPEDYVLGDDGQIISQRRGPDLIGDTAPDVEDRKTNYSHFDSGAQPDTRECGPSPATPAEINRLVVDAAQRYNVDIDLAVAVVTAESRLDRLRNSPKGARGPMQLMPETAKRFGVADICDPEENIDGGVRYLRELADEFRNPLLIAAAYNAGEGRVREYGGIPPFKETVGYVAEVLNIKMGLTESEPVRPSEVNDRSRPSNSTGVIISRDRRQWVGGVMHF